MTNVISYSVSAYIKHLKLLLLFSLSFIIAFLIPLFASLPAYNDMGAIFLRTASLFLNLNMLNASIIAIGVFFSLLFLSFALVAINIMVKHSRAHLKIREEVLRGLERYTSKVFLVLLIFTAIVLLVNVLSYGSGFSGILTYVVALALTPFLFYAPSSIVIDDYSIGNAIKASLRFFTKRFDYFLVWLGIAIVLITFFDFVFIVTTGTMLSRYVMLVFNSLFILPFLAVLQSEMYVKRFPLLKR